MAQQSWPIWVSNHTHGGGCVKKEIRPLFWHITERGFRNAARRRIVSLRTDCVERNVRFCATSTLEGFAKKHTFVNNVHNSRKEYGAFGTFRRKLA